MSPAIHSSFLNADFPLINKKNNPVHKTSEMAQRVKTLAIKPPKINPVSMNHIGEGEN